MHAKISAGNDCLRFSRVAGGNLPAPASNLREAFIVCIRADFNKPSDVSFYPVPKQFDQSNHLLPDSVPKKVDCSLLALQSVIQKNKFQ